MSEPMTSERLAEIEETVIGDPWVEALRDELVAEVRRLKQHEAATIDAHRLFDRIGIPKAAGQPCDDPECYTQTGHRLRQVIAEVTRLRDENASLREDAERLDWLLDSYGLEVGCDRERIDAARKANGA
jgi:hypothetical protein